MIGGDNLMNEAVATKGMTVSLGGRKVLEEITIKVNCGELTGVIGPNGAGKTTLLRALLGLVSLEAGELIVLGASDAGLKEVRPQIGYMPQRQSFEKRFPLSAADVVATGLLSPYTLLRRLPNQKEATNNALASVGMKAYADRPFPDLSGGEQQRILLARSVVRKPKLLLLDEPNSGLDFPAQRSFLDLLVKLKEEENLAVILVSHDLISVASAADQLVCINRTMHVHGQPSEVLHSPQLDDAYRCQFDFLSSTAGETGCKH
jgi:ABC-type Mn2+/Zn2+ transport system ATPase subunit